MFDFEYTSYIWRWFFRGFSMSWMVISLSTANSLDQGDIGKSYLIIVIPNVFYHPYVTADVILMWTIFEFEWRK